jgi:hypothetical protein
VVELDCLTATPSHPGRQQDHERADHPVGFLGVLVGSEELAGAIDEQVVQLGTQLGADGQSEVARDQIELALRVSRVELDLALADLPRVPHPRIEQRLLPQTVASRSRHVTQLLGCTM